MLFDAHCTSQCVPCPASSLDGESVVYRIENGVSVVYTVENRVSVVYTVERIDFPTKSRAHYQTRKNIEKYTTK